MAEEVVKVGLCGKTFLEELRAHFVIAMERKRSVCHI